MTETEGVDFNSKPPKEDTGLGKLLCERCQTPLKNHIPFGNCFPFHSKGFRPIARLIRRNDNG